MHYFYISIIGVFSVPWSFRNHSNMLICCSRNSIFNEKKVQKNIIYGNLIYFITLTLLSLLINLTHPCWIKSTFEKQFIKPAQGENVLWGFSSVWLFFQCCFQLLKSQVKFRLFQRTLFTSAGSVLSCSCTIKDLSHKPERSISISPGLLDKLLRKLFVTTDASGRNS